MKARFPREALALVLLIGTFFTSRDLQACGVERWSVKTGTDADSGLVNLSSPMPNDVATMDGWTKPSSIPANNRLSPFETTVWVLNATLTQYKAESDQDYHLILQDASGNTLIAEIPDPACVGSGSPFATGIANARAQFDAQFVVSSSFQSANVPVQVTGIGMFDFLHGQTGVAPNGIELHPVIDIIFNPSSNPDFGISASPGSLSSVQGSSAATTVTTSVSGGFSSAVSLVASGVPSGASASFSPASIGAPGGGSSTLTLSAGTAAPGTYTITVNGSGGGKSHSTTVSFTVTAAANPDFGISVSPGSVTAARGSSVNTTVTTTVSGGFNSAVSLVTSGVPSGASASFSPASIGAPGAGSSTLRLSAGTAATGTYTVTVTGSGGGKSHSTTVSFTVTSSASPDFTVAVSPGSASVAQGSSTAPTVTTVVSGGFNSAVSLSASGVPSGATASFSPASIGAPGGGSSTLTLSAGTAAAGTYSITITASGGGKTHTAAYSLTVTSGGITPQQLLQNPGFESGNVSWTTTSGVISNSTGELPNSGSWYAWLDGYGSTHTDTLNQQVTIPSAASSATLSFWLHIDTAETTTTTMFDTLKVQVRSSSGTVLATLATYSNLDANTGYTQVSFDLSAYKGRTIQINLIGSEDFTKQTSFVVDDFALNVR
ncbi:MAG: hypothetical protein M3O15_08140 [Acidobacteriota bacterium]|nr:hypothetical protein [Acidobacteriota bacterium]